MSPQTNLPADPSDNVPHDPTALREHPAVRAVYAGLSLRKAGAAHDVPTPTLNRWVHIVRAHFGDEGLPDAYLRRSRALTRKPSSPAAPHATYGYPIYDKVPAGAFGCAYPASEPTGQFATDLYVPSRSSSPPPFAMRVVGHSMTNPASPIQFPDGCVVLCDPARQPTLGDFVVAMDRTDGSLTLKQLTNRVPLPGRDLWLTPLNPDPAYAAVHLDDENHEVLGVVVEAQMPLYRR